MRALSGWRGVSLALCVFSLGFFALAPAASAGPPTHARTPSLDISGLNHACGVAADSKGDLYVASAGESKVNVYDSSHALLTSIPDSSEPCGLAVSSKGELFVSERGTGKVVRFKPNAYPFAGTPTYGSAEPIDVSGNAKGIAVDPTDDRIYVAEGTHIAVYKSDGSFEVNVGEPALSEASGVAAYTSPTGDRYLFAADARGVALDQLLVFSGPSIAGLKLRRELNGSSTPSGSFGFGAAGAYLAVDPGNKEAGGPECAAVAEQACTAGHLLLYDAAHGVLDEFEASGEYLDQMSDPAFADAQPSAVAIERSGGASDGTLYLAVGSGPAAKTLAFGPLAAPSRATLDEPLSHVLAGAEAVATDSHGNVYVAAGSLIKVFSPTGTEIKVGPTGKGVSDTKVPLEDLAVDSQGHVYVLEEKAAVTYYTPSIYPPVDGTVYARHEPIVISADFPEVSNRLGAIAVNPGPGAGRDRLFLASNDIVREYKTAAEGSGVLNEDFAAGLVSGPKLSIAVYGASAHDGEKTEVYIGSNPSAVTAVNTAGTEVIARIDGSGCPMGQFENNPVVAVDQANGHILEFQPDDEAAREYDGAGACVAEFGRFTSTVSDFYRIAVDSACATHVNSEGKEEPLDETTTPTCHEYDPADGRAYVAFAHANPATNRFDLSAFGPLSYSGPPISTTGTPSEVGGGEATLNGSVNPNGFDVSECRFEYLEEGEYISNGKTFAGAEEATCVPSPAAIGKGSASVAVHATIDSLDPEGHYCFTLVAANQYGPSEGKAVCFGSPRIETEPASPVRYGEATLRATVDPSGLATTYRFQYGEAAGEYDHSTEPHLLTAGMAPTAVEAALTGLDEGVEYHFRIVAENEANMVSGPDQTFTTLQRRGAESCPNIEYRTGLSAKLPDCRAYELTTPAETNGLSPYSSGAGGFLGGFDHWLTPPRGTTAGQSLSYFIDGTLPGFEGNGVLDGYRTERGSGDHPDGGWRSRLFGPTYAQADPGAHQSPGPHGISSDQLYSFWRIDPEESSATLAAGLYLRVPDGTANPQCLPAEPKQLDFELLGCGSLGTDPEASDNYLSAGGAHAIFSSTAQLESNAPPPGIRAIYDRAAGSNNAEVVSVDPNGVAFGGDASYLGSNEAGSTIVFSAGGALYLHREGHSVEIAEAPFTFAGISDQGEKVFYAATGNGGLAAPLYLCDTQAGPCAGPGAHGPASIATTGIFAGVSADGSHAFFSSAEALTATEENENGEEAEAGARNLYDWDGADTHFISRLSSADFAAAAFGGIAGMNLGAWTRAINPGAGSGRALVPTRSTPGGDVFVFQSHARLGAYDNNGVGEIYRYDPSAPEGERLTCPSCDPSAAAPSADALFEDIGTAIDAHTLIPNLTEDGTRVFFTSADRLLPEDANRAADVYEWRARGTRWGGGASAPSCERSGGCLALISSGQGEQDNLLYGMSADGHDVFFITLEQLLGTDVAGSSSIYDAREGGGIPDALSAPICAGDACQGNGSTPPFLPAPSSTGSEGGDVVRQACAKGRHRVKGRCVKTHRKKHHKRRHHPSHRRGASR